MSDLLYDCARGTEFICSDAASSDSCQYAKLTAEDIFTKTFDKWNYKYKFSAYVDIASPLVEAGEGCRGELTSKTYPLPITTGQMFVKLDICR